MLKALSSATTYMLPILQKEEIVAVFMCVLKQDGLILPLPLATYISDDSFRSFSVEKLT